MSSPPPGLHLMSNIFPKYCSRHKMHVIILLIMLSLSSCSYDFDFDDDDTFDPQRETLMKNIPVFIKRSYAEWSTKATCNDRIIRSTQATMKTKTFQWFNYKVRLPRRTSPVLEAHILVEFHKISDISQIDKYNYSIDMSSKGRTSSVHTIKSCDKVASDNVLELFFNITNIYEHAKQQDKKFLQLRFRFHRFTTDESLLSSQDVEDLFVFKELKAFLVTYEDNKDCNSFSREVDWHSRRVLKSVKQRLRRESQESHLEQQVNFYPVEEGYYKRCRLIDWHVSFKTIGWNSFVIAPSGVNARACSGVCGFPIKVNSTEHAILQSIISFNYNRDTSASCVPISTSPRTLILYDDSDESISIANFPHLIADSCGCR